VLPIGAHPGRLHPDQALRACYLSTVPSSIAETLAVPLLDAIEEFPTSKELVALGHPGAGALSARLRKSTQEHRRE